MEKQVQKQCDFEPREYQQNIIDVCIKKNSIVYLHTGAGKTFIALQVIKHFSDQLKPKYSEGGKRSFFLVNTVALAKQQAEHIRQFLPFDLCILTGESSVDTFERTQWNKLLDENEIFVMTAQCFADGVARTFIRLESISVIVFDECHHGRKGHVYHQIMQKFENCPEAENIRIIGLSGMLVGNDNKTKAETVSEELNKLESTYQSTIITVNTVNDCKNVLIYSTKAKEFFVKYNFTPLQKCLQHILFYLTKLQSYLMPIKLERGKSLNPKTLREMIPSKIKDLIDILNDFEYQTHNMGNYGSYLGLLSILIQFELTKRSADSTNFRNIVKTCITKVEYCIDLMKRELGVDKKEAEIVLENSSEKVQKLLLLLTKFYNDPNREKDMQCLIFVERRSAAKILYHLIKCYGHGDKNFPIKPDFVVGRNSSMPESIESILSKSNNMLALEKFNNKETNCIVCTNVLEEGIDLQACNLVIVYDPPKTLRSYAQSRGRARDDTSSYIILLENAEMDKFHKKYLVWKSADQAMKNELIGKTIDRLPPDEIDIKNEQKQQWPPFYTKENACLTSLNCIPILNQYAQTLPADRFTDIRIGWNRFDEKGKVKVCLQLPVQSMLDIVITGEFRQNVKIAKQDAAFKACINLYNSGNLTEQLTPVDSNLKVEEYCEAYFDHWNKYKLDDAKNAGTKKNGRFHKIKKPKALEKCGPKIGTNFLYRIIIKPNFTFDNNNAFRVFHMLLDNENTFGILTSKRIAKTCKMTLFQSFGEINCEISDVPTVVEIEDELGLLKLQKFHVNIFRDMLQSFQNFFVLDKDSYLVAPINEFSEIAWPLINEFIQIHKPTKLTKSQKQNMTFRPDDYLYNVINPVYREHTDQNYIVINIVHDKNPLSQFPNKNNAQTYAEYFKEKYNVTIENMSQFLIEVKGISKNLHLFFPGSGISGKQKKYERLNECEEYIPEICHNYKFPGDYWLKATLLPAICHRLHQMLLAEELRRWLISEKIDNDCDLQKYELDIDYGDYEQREEIAKNFNFQTAEKLDDFHQILKKIQDDEIKVPNNKVIRTEANLIWGNSSYLPIDIDRNWLSITEVDLDYYRTFTNNSLEASSVHKKILNLELIRRQNFGVLSIKDKEVCKDINLLNYDSFSRSIQQKDLVKVLTTANAGDVFDMERFEALGDAFLKFITSLYLYKTYDKWHEGHLTAIKGKLVSNRNLFYIGNDFGLSSMIKSTQFNQDSSFAPSTMLPTNIKQTLQNNKNLLRCLLDVDAPLPYEEIESGIMKKNLNLFKVDSSQLMDQNDDIDKELVGFVEEQFIGDKIVADAVEALLGCTVATIGTTAALTLCQKLKILPEEKTQGLLLEAIHPRIVFESDVKLINQQRLENVIKYKFKNSVFLTQALTHASYPNKSSGTYQQLEFLGDAVLDFLITSYIFERCPKMSPGKLTDLRSALVNNVTLACIIVRNDIHKHLLFESQTLSEAIKTFVDFQKSQNYEITDQIVLLNTENDTNIAKSIEVPKALGDIFESIIGAVFLDTNLSLETTWKVIYQLMQHEIHEFMENVPLQIIRRLYEFQGGSACPQFFETEMIQDDDNVAVPLKYKKDGHEKYIIGFGRNRKLAKEAAAKKALLELSKD